MVDAADRRRISRASVDRLSCAYVRATYMASIAVGRWYWLGYRSESVVLGFSDHQVVLVAAGIISYLADFMGAANETTCRMTFRMEPDPRTASLLTVSLKTPVPGILLF